MNIFGKEEEEPQVDDTRVISNSLGIDLGTSAMKLLLMDAAGTIHNTVTKEYPLEFPKPGCAAILPR